MNPSRKRSTSKWVRASREPCRRPRSCACARARSRPSGASIVPLRDPSVPSASARYSRTRPRAPDQRLELVAAPLHAWRRSSDPTCRGRAGGRRAASRPFRASAPGARRASCPGVPAPDGPRARPACRRRAGRRSPTRCAVPGGAAGHRRSVGLRVGEDDPLAAPQAVALCARLAVHQHRAAVDQAARRAREWPPRAPASHESSRSPAASGGTSSSSGIVLGRSMCLRVRLGRQQHQREPRDAPDDRDVCEVERRPQRVDR